MYLTFRIIPASFLIALFIQLCIAEDSIGEKHQPKELRISKINIYGNRTTKSKAIKLLMGLDTAAIFDSLQLRIGEKRLEETNLFSKVDVFVLKKEQGVEIFIIVVESLYLQAEAGRCSRTSMEKKSLAETGTGTEKQ